MWNEFKERFIQWFEKIKALFLEEAQQMDPIRDQFENFEKRVILGNGAQAKIRIGLSEDATRIFEVEKAAYDGESPWAKDVLEKDVAHNPAAIYIVLGSGRGKSLVSSERERQREQIYISRMLLYYTIIAS